MVEKGRTTTRRKSDQLILETIRFNRTILDLLQGKEGDFAETFLRIQQLSAKLGRRQEDRRL